MQPVRQQRATPQGATTTVDPGSDRFLGTVTDRRGAILDAVRLEGSDTISLNLVGAAIPDAAKAVLGDALGLNYVVEANVAGQITLQSSTPLTRASLLEAFQTALDYDPTHYPALNGVAVCKLNIYLGYGGRSARDQDSARRDAISKLRRSLRVNGNQPRIVELLRKYE